MDEIFLEFDKVTASERIQQYAWKGKDDLQEVH